jgi:hypothetical protein
VQTRARETRRRGLREGAFGELERLVQEELAFLKRLRFKGKRPTPLYYYRELQGLRDPLHFHTP